MYQSHWGLRDTPFRTCPDPGSFYPSPAHDEALARLQFLVEQHRCLGLLVGESGSGKSLLLEVLAAQLRRTGRTVVRISLLGLQSTEMLWQLATALGCRPQANASVGILWQAITDRLTEHRYEHRDVALLLDDADRAAEDVLTHVLRLVHFGSTAESRLTIVLAGRPSRVARWGHDLIDLADLRVDVEPWDETDTEHYLRESMARAGSPTPVFAQDAVARLQQLTQGVPRRVNQLADMVLIAGAGQNLHHVDAELVQSAYEELVPADAV